MSAGHLPSSFDDEDEDLVLTTFPIDPGESTMTQEQLNFGGSASSVFTEPSSPIKGANLGRTLDPPASVSPAGRCRSRQGDQNDAPQFATVTKTKKMFHGMPIEPQLDDLRNFTGLSAEAGKEIDELFAKASDRKVYNQLLVSIDALEGLFTAKNMVCRVFNPIVRKGYVEFEYDRLREDGRSTVSGRLPKFIVPLDDLHLTGDASQRIVVGADVIQLLECVHCSSQFKEKSTLNRHFATTHGVWDNVALMGDSLIPRPDKSKINAHLASHEEEIRNIDNCQVITQGILIAYFLMQIPCNVVVKVHNMLIIARLIFHATPTHAYGPLVGTEPKCISKYKTRSARLKKLLEDHACSKGEAGSISTDEVRSCAKAVATDGASEQRKQEKEDHQQQSKRLKMIPFVEPVSSSSTDSSEDDRDVVPTFSTVDHWVSELMALLVTLGQQLKDCEEPVFDIPANLHKIATSSLPRSLQYRFARVTQDAHRASCGRISRSKDPHVAYQDVREMLGELLDIIRAMHQEPTLIPLPPIPTAPFDDEINHMVDEIWYDTSSGYCRFDIEKAFDEFDDAFLGGLIQN